MNTLWEMVKDNQVVAVGVFWKSTLLLVLACLGSLLMRRASAARRHFLWTLAILSVLALPALSILVPAWHVPAAVRTPLVASPISMQPMVVSQTRAPEVPAAPIYERSVPWIPAVWLGGFLFFAGRLLLGIARIFWIARNSRSSDTPGWQELLADSARSIGLRRAVKLCESAPGTMPITCGVLRAKILLPAEAREWSAERLRLVLLHELSHVKRCDWLTQLLTQMAVAIYWFNPLVWFLSHESQRDRERACDDAVIAAGVKASNYGGHLLEIARSFQSVPVAIAMARWSDLELRLRALLDRSVDRQTITRRWSVAGALTAALILVPLAALRAPAQSGTATLGGTVTDVSRAAVPGARIMLSNTDNGHKEVAVTDEVGHYVFRSLAPGKYRVEVSQPGFALFQRTLTLEGGAEARQDATLDLGRIDESVDVVGRSGRPVQKTAGPQRIRVGGNVQASKLISQVKPEYPQSAKDQGIQGTVTLQAIIALDGSLMSVTSLNSHVDQQLIDAAMAAAKQWRYQPTLLNGQPVEVVTTISVNFRLE